MTPSESAQHREIKEIISEKLKEWTGATLTEYSSSGHELDVFAVTPTGISIYIEIIWSSSRTNFFRDMNMIQTSDANVKLVVGSPKVLERDEFQRVFEKVAISQRRLNIAMHGNLIDGEKILTESDFINTEFKPIVLSLINKVKVRGKLIGAQTELEPPKPTSVDEIEESLLSNLFPVKNYPETIFVSPTAVKTDGEVFKKLGDKIQEIPFMIKNKTLYTFDNLKVSSSPFFPIILENDVNEEKVHDWIQDDIKRNDLIRLFNLSLKKYCESRELWYDKKHYRFVCLLKEGRTRTFKWRPETKYAIREIATCIKEQEGKILYCKHYAANLRFMFLDDNIYLKISPTMTFTYDGFRPIRSRKLASLMSRYLSKQYNSQYLDLVRFWSKFLSKLDVTISIPLGKEHIKVESEPIGSQILVGIKEERSI